MPKMREFEADAISDSLKRQSLTVARERGDGNDVADVLYYLSKAVECMSDSDLAELEKRLERALMIFEANLKR